MRVGIVAPFIQLQSSIDAQRAHEQASLQSNETSSSVVSQQLYACAIAADGFSGRALRKLPFLAHTLCASNAEVEPSQVCLLNLFYASFALAKSFTSVSQHVEKCHSE